MYTLAGLRRVAVWLTVLFGVLLIAQQSVFAIARGYETDDDGLQTGMAVSLSTNTDGNKVERASGDNVDRIVGIVTTYDSSLVTVSSKTAKVLVESEGEVDAYVSDSNGQIKKGDLLTLSDYKGILAKGSENQGRIIAIAANDFDSGSPESYDVKDGSTTKQIKISKIKINLNRQGGNTPAAAVSDSSLAKLGKAIVGKDVGDIRVVIAMIIFFIVLIAEGGILYGAISSSITALGRNPLAKTIIRKELIRVVIIAVIVLFVGLGAIYGILWA